MESFGAKFPRIYSDTGFKGWFTSVLLLFAWFGSLCNAPISDNFGRKLPLLGTFIVYTGWSIGCALSHNTASILIFRLLSGIFAASGLVLSGYV